MEDKYHHLMPVRRGSTNMPEIIVSGEVLEIFQWLFFSVLILSIDVFGTVANIINIVCLVKQGFKDIVNISFLGLAISDLGCLVPLIWSNICFIPAFIKLDLPFEPIEFQYLTGAAPHVIFTRATSWITVFITLERCLCITMPLKVKMLFTHRRVTVIIVCIFIFIISNMIPVYCVNLLVWKFSPARNRTLIGLDFTSDRVLVETVLFAINNMFLQFSSFLTVVICTVTLVAKLRSKSQWRDISASSGQKVLSSSRDKRVNKMVVAVSTVFIGCFFPVCLIVIGMIVEPEFSIEGRYRNFFLLLCGLAFFLESANSSMNIFIYYHMSTKYRAAFRKVILRQVE